jgi:aminoglycoside 3-N-acetyltransferase
MVKNARKKKKTRALQKADGISYCAALRQRERLSIRMASDLRALGLPRDEVYLIHSPLGRVGALADGPKTFIEAMRDTCGPRSLIVAPAFTAGNSTTSDEYRRRTARMSMQQLVDEEARIAGFHPQTTPAQNVGIVAEYIRNEPGSARSRHPQTSFTAIGPRAEELVGIHELDCHLGEKSPLGWLYDNNAVVLLIDVGFEACTCFHLAEYRLDRPAELRPYRTFVMNEGQRELREFYAPDTDARDFALIGNEMTSEPFVHVGRVGQAPAYWFRLRAAVDYAVSWMNRFR